MLYLQIIVYVYLVLGYSNTIVVLYRISEQILFLSFFLDGERLLQFSYQMFVLFPYKHTHFKAQGNEYVKPYQEIRFSIFFNVVR